MEHEDEYSDTISMRSNVSAMTTMVKHSNYQIHLLGFSSYNHFLFLADDWGCLCRASREAVTTSNQESRRDGRGVVGTYLHER